MPIKTTDFAKMLELGLGRAVLYAQQHDMTAYREVILNACLHNQAYDAPLEGTRADYLFQLIHLTSEFEYYCEKTLAHFAWSSKEPDRDSDQVDDLTGLFAKYGNLEARQKIYAKFEANESDPDHGAMYQIIKIAGAEGFKYVVKRAINALLKNAEHQATSVYFLLEEEVGKAGAELVLADLMTDLTTRKFAKLIRRYKLEPRRRKPELTETMPYGKLKARIKRGTQSGYRDLTKWGQSASPEMLITAARDLLVQTDRKRLADYLIIFARTPFPLDPLFLFPYTTHHDEYIAVRAWTALTQIKSPVVRQFGFEKMQDPKIRWRARDLLIANYEPGDWQLFETFSAQESYDAQELHGLGMTIKRLFDAHPDTEAEASLLNMYETDPCGMCRFQFVKNIHTLGKLPDWMRDECRYDSYSGTREFIAELDLAESEANLGSA